MILKLQPVKRESSACSQILKHMHTYKTGYTITSYNKPAIQKSAIWHNIHTIVNILIITNYTKAGVLRVQMVSSYIAMCYACKFATS